jgi:hypothetical protein
MPNTDDAANHEVAKAPASEAQRELAMAWVAGQVGEDDFAETDDPMFADDPLLVEVDAFDDELPMPTVDSSAPDWLLAALAAAAPAEGGN